MRAHMSSFYLKVETKHNVLEILRRKPEQGNGCNNNCESAQDKDTYISSYGCLTSEYYLDGATTHVLNERSVKV